MADVAQLVESQIVILVVAGSSPVVRPTDLHSIGLYRIFRWFYSAHADDAFRAASLVLSLADLFV